MKMMENIYLSAIDVRSLCVEKGWYTNGSNEDYKILLSMPYKKDGITLKKITLNTLYNMACDILIHSDMEEYYGCSLDETLEEIMNELNRKAKHYIHIID